MIISINNQNDLRLLDILVEAQRKNNAKIGFTSGCFDLPHRWHHYYLERCRRLLGENGILVVGVDSDRLVRATKGPPRPVIDEANRAEMINAIYCTDLVFVMDSLDDFLRMVKLLRPTIFRNEDIPLDQVIGREFAAEVVSVPDVDMLPSTSKIIDSIVQGHERNKGATSEG
jgi:D-beta-D-heptose 7-phosphate kinase/D-beta-D-heptose 1-phosphate adenosyltransferase